MIYVQEEIPRLFECLEKKVPFFALNEYQASNFSFVIKDSNLIAVFSTVNFDLKNKLQYEYYSNAKKIPKVGL